MKKYTASVTYDLDTVTRLSEMVSRTYRRLPRAAAFLLGFLCLVLGLFASLDGIAALLCIAFGCFIITSVRVPAKRRAAQDYRAIGGKPLTVSYTFSDRAITVLVAGEAKTLPYEKLIRLSCDREYLYLFEDKRSAYMIRMDSLVPSDPAGLRAALSQKTKLRWKRVSPFSFIAPGK